MEFNILELLCISAGIVCIAGGLVGLFALSLCPGNPGAVLGRIESL